MFNSRAFLLCMTPALLAAAGCGSDSKLAGKWQGQSADLSVNIHFDPSGELHASGTGYPEQHGTWQVTYEDRRSAKLKVTDATGVWDATATFHPDGTATMRFGDRTLSMRMVEAPPKNYATQYFLVLLCLVLTLIIFFRARRRAEEPDDMVEARRHAPKSLFHVETAVDRGS